MMCISGKQGSGKTTAADLLQDHLGDQLVQVKVGDLIRAQATPGLWVMRFAREQGRDAQVEAVASTVGITPQQAAVFVDALDADSRDLDLTMDSRTAGVRTVLQNLGGAWRPADFWAGRVVEQAYLVASQGRIPLVVANLSAAEHRAYTDAGMLMVRLDIRAETQRRRILARDGHEPVGTDHTTETDCDQLDFDLRIPTDRLDATQVSELLEAFIDCHRETTTERITA